MGEHVRVNPTGCPVSPPVIAQSVVTPIPLGPRAPPGLGPVLRCGGVLVLAEQTAFAHGPSGRPEREATGRSLSVFGAGRV